MKRRLAFLSACVGLVLALAAPSGPAHAQDSQVVIPPWSKNMIKGPPCAEFPQPWEGSWSDCSQAALDRWTDDIRHWRTERRMRIGFDGARYDNAATRWAQSAFIQTQTMVEDRYLYDPVAGRYTVDRYLDDLERRYGGVDAVLIWPTYPNIGVDDRNQLDMLASMPGGIEGVKGLVADFHRRGVRVLFPFMMWDQGTRDPGQPWPAALAQVMARIGADGMNGDTQDGVPLAFSVAADASGHPLAFQPEGQFHDEQLSWNLMSWGQYDFGFAPKVDRYRWLEPRHMVNISDRWARSKVDDLQYAFFNGTGWESWENIWGIWNGITPRDAEATRRVATLERALAPFLVSQDWQPYYRTLQYGVFASRWPLGEKAVWTLVNRLEYDLEGAQMEVDGPPGTRWFDLYRGVELFPREEGGRQILAFPIEAHGYSAVIALPGAPDAGIAALMSRMKAMTQKPLESFSAEWTPLKQTLLDAPPGRTATSAPEGMVEVPAADFRFRVHGIEIEGMREAGVDVAYPWENSARRFHDRVVPIKRFFIDRTPVTNRQFKAFLDATHYRPRDAENFLKDWQDGRYAAGADERPVTWVSIEDARAYAAWAGKRLPREWEWQYAAQGTDQRIYPWGNGWDAARVPTPARGRRSAPPDLVATHPAGASPFGALDMVGTVWQWTDEFVDEHTRAAIVRGGSNYQPQGSIWYFRQAYRNDEHGKLLLMSPGRDRSGLIGFRCVVDASS